eukprot:733519-Pyramimonas_sp.AAC.1
MSTACDEAVGARLEATDRYVGSLGVQVSKQEALDARVHALEAKVQEPENSNKRGMRRSKSTGSFEPQL